LIVKRIGILGGIGPQATMDIEARLHHACQKLIPQSLNEGYPPLVTYYVRHPPVEVDDGQPRMPLTLDPRMLDAARDLGRLCDLMIVASNTPHLFLDELGQAAGCETLSIVDVTVEELRRCNATPIGLLGLGTPAVYSQRFDAESFEVRVPPQELRDRLTRSIFRLMEGGDPSEIAQPAIDAVRSVREQGAEVTVLGCTEIPILLGAAADEPDLVNPGQLLAEAVVRRAIADG